MPIKRLSERRQIPRIGKIRLGIKVQGERSEYPRAVDYFVVNSDQSTSDGAAKAFHEVYGDKPRLLHIMLPVEETDKFFAQWYKRYGSGTGLVCKGDGELAQEIDKETGEIVEHVCNPDICEWYAKKHCRAIGSIQFLLYKVPGLGIWQIDTSSYHSIVQLNSGIDYVKSLTGGRIAMIPLLLAVRPKEVTVEGRKKHIWVMDIASETMKMEDIMLASRLEPIQLLLPESIENDPPDDLFPASLINPEGPADPAADPASEPTLQEQMLDHFDRRFGNQDVDEQLANMREDGLLVKLHACWDVLGTTLKRRNANLSKVGLDKEELLMQLLQAIGERGLQVPGCCIEQTPASDQMDETDADQDAPSADQEEPESGEGDAPTTEADPAEELLGKTGEEWVAPWEQPNQAGGIGGNG
jgi:hypothetical protein